MKKEKSQLTPQIGRAVVQGKSVDLGGRRIIKKKNNLTLNLKELEKEEQTKPKVSRRKEIIKIRAEINEIERKKTVAKINKTKSLFFEKINKIDKPLARLIKKKREKTQINRIRNEKGEVTTDTAEGKARVKVLRKERTMNHLGTEINPVKWKIKKKN